MPRASPANAQPRTLANRRHIPRTAHARQAHPEPDQGPLAPSPPPQRPNREHPAVAHHRGHPQRSGRRLRLAPARPERRRRRAAHRHAVDRRRRRHRGRMVLGLDPAARPREAGSDAGPDGPPLRAGRRRPRLPAGPRPARERPDQQPRPPALRHPREGHRTAEHRPVPQARPRRRRTVAAGSRDRTLRADELVPVGRQGTPGGAARRRPARHPPRARAPGARKHAVGPGMAVGPPPRSEDPREEGPRLPRQIQRPAGSAGHPVEPFPWLEPTRTSNPGDEHEVIRPRKCTRCTRTGACPAASAC